MRHLIASVAARLTSTASTPHCSWSVRCLFCLGTVAALGWPTIPVEAAAPVVYQFDVIVTDIEEINSPTLDLPFGPSVGSSFNGELELEQDEVTGAVRTLNISFLMDGVAFATDNYHFVALDDLSTTLEPLGSVDSLRRGPINVISPGLLRLVDTGVPPFRDLVLLTLRDGVDFPVIQRAPGILPSSDALWQLAMSFEGSDDVLQTESVPIGLSEWNSFSSRAIQLGFDPASGPRSSAVVITGTIGEFTIVPEPCAFTLGCVLMVAIGRLSRTSSESTYTAAVAKKICVSHVERTV